MKAIVYTHAVVVKRVPPKPPYYCIRFPGYKNQQPGRTTGAIAGSSKCVNSAQDIVIHKAERVWDFEEGGAAW